VFNVIHTLQNKGIVHQIGNKNKFIKIVWRKGRITDTEKKKINNKKIHMTTESK
jgi:hypothetical protein